MYVVADNEIHHGVPKEMKHKIGLPARNVERGRLHVYAPQKKNFLNDCSSRSPHVHGQRLNRRHTRSLSAPFASKCLGQWPLS